MEPGFPGQSHPTTAPDTNTSSLLLPAEYASPQMPEAVTNETEPLDDVSVSTESSANSIPEAFVANIRIQTADGLFALAGRYDTGSDVNLIAESVLKHLKGIDLEPNDLIRRWLFDHSATVVGRIKLIFQIAHRPQEFYKAWFYVIAERDEPRFHDFLLCANFIRKHGLLSGTLSTPLKASSSSSANLRKGAPPERERAQVSDTEERQGEVSPQDGSLAHCRSRQIRVEEDDTSHAGQLIHQDVEPRTASLSHQTAQEPHVDGFPAETSAKASSERIDLTLESCPGLTEGITLERASLLSPREDQAFLRLSPQVLSSIENDRSVEGILEKDAGQPDESFDVRSVLSNNDDVASQASLERPTHDMWLEDYLANSLVEDGDISTLCKQALSGLSKERVTRNLRRLLKLYYLELAKRATSDAEKNAVALLRRRVSRERVANMMISSFNASTEMDQLQIESNVQTAKSRIEVWLNGTQFGAGADGRNATISSLIDAHDSGSDSESEPPPPPSGPIDLGQLENFMKSGVPFCRFRAALQAFLLPASLSSITRILLTIPNERISFLDSCKQSFSDRIKSRLESVSGAKWNWWPLSPSNPPLVSGNVRIKYLCVRNFASIQIPVLDS